MPQQIFPVNATKIEFVCDCGKGVFRRDQAKPVEFKYPMSYPHKCTHCGLEGGFPVAYPMLEVASNNRLRRFMLEDETAKPTGPVMNKKPDNSFLWLK